MTDDNYSVLHKQCKISNFMASDRKVKGNHLIDLHLTTSIEAVTRRCFVKEIFLIFLQNSQENTCARISFLKNLQPKVWNFSKKENLAQVFSHEFCQSFKNNYFRRTLRWLLLSIFILKAILINKLVSCFSGSENNVPVNIERHTICYFHFPFFNIGMTFSERIGFLSPN